MVFKWRLSQHTEHGRVCRLWQSLWTLSQHHYKRFLSPYLTVRQAWADVVYSERPKKKVKRTLGLIFCCRFKREAFATKIFSKRLPAQLSTNRIWWRRLVFSYIPGLLLLSFTKSAARFFFSIRLQVIVQVNHFTEKALYTNNLGLVIFNKIHDLTQTDCNMCNLLKCNLIVRRELLARCSKASSHGWL